ncbi:MAG: Gfo/Idh/MocA family oxidoreductase, partial [Candidatus Lindowbacteria bacterium]|nr:Gfo/Idh/MocA family oxidoreductase [Candidatus Lindowbacteria bacterium]
GKKNKIPVFDSMEELAEKCDALTIAAPTVYHYETAKTCIELGKHVLVEKPITPTLKEAEGLLNLAADKNVLLQVGHVERFNGAILAIRDLVNEPRFIEVHRLSPFPDRSTDIGVILDVMIHDIDILLSLVRSKVTSIDSIGTAVVTNREDIANVRIKFESGCVANVTASRISYQTLRKIRIFSADRYISVDYHKQAAVMYKKKAGIETVGSVSDIERISPKITKTEPLRAELEAFVQAVAGGTGRAATGEEGKNALQVALEIGQQINEN